jgi:hypothetical protein
MSNLCTHIIGYIFSLKIISCVLKKIQFIGVESATIESIFHCTIPKDVPLCQWTNFFSYRLLRILCGHTSAHQCDRW